MDYQRAMPVSAGHAECKREPRKGEHGLEGFMEGDTYLFHRHIRKARRCVVVFGTPINGDSRDHVGLGTAPPWEDSPDIVTEGVFRRFFRVIVEKSRGIQP